MTQMLRSFLVALTFTILSTGCERSTAVLEPDDANTIDGAALAARPRFVTLNADTFAAVLRAVDRRNEIMIWIRDDSIPPVAIPAGADTLFSNRYTLLLPTASRRAEGRSLSDLARFRAGPHAKESLSGMLSSGGASNVRVGLTLPFVSATLPADSAALRSVLQQLIQHPNFDLAEPNRAVPASFP